MAKAIMIQGTMSNVGKSFLVAGLCRIMKQDGYRVAPFKSQNMALNSYITEDGLEMGRAQVMQAEAAGVKPDVCMNPILLKPTTDVGSQVIVHGKPIANMRATAYYAYKKHLLADVLDAYRKLEENYDVIVIEGAGSPVELNLKQDDFVNMGLAKMLSVPVVLAGDIDRGGVFAQLIGTCDLLEPKERELVKGLIVNKFRGDAALFQDGVHILEEKSGIPVLGVVPYMHVDLEDEDSLSEKFKSSAEDGEAMVKLAVIRLPRISNFTDFDVFRQYAGVQVSYVSHPDELEAADMVIIPGTKSTIQDLLWMRQNGLEAAIKKYAAGGMPVVGICGGYQMLGEVIRDPYQMESGGEISGMGLLPIETIFARDKTTRQTRGRIERLGGDLSCLSDMEFYGYEIHMGESSLCGCARQAEGKDIPDAVFHVQNVYGSYIHGIFDAPHIAEKIVQMICNKKHVSCQTASVDRQRYKELQYDRLAQGLRDSLDMEQVYRILQLKKEK